MRAEVKQRLREVSFPLRTVTADSNFDDLQPFKEMLDGVRIVGLGESSHGTRELFQLKHRLIRFLVEECGFRVFTIEAGLEPVRAIDDYVMKGKDDKYRALGKQGYWTWDTVEVMDLIDWMRNHNLSCSRGKECDFYGIDMKPIEGACDWLIDYLKPIAGDEYEELKQILLDCRATAWMFEGQNVISPVNLLGWIKYNEIPLIEKSSPGEYALALENAAYICQYMDCMLGYSKNPDSTNRDRDFYMAENVEHLMNELPAGNKIILWAHNGHIGVDSEWKNLGWELRQRFGTQYLPCALSFGTGGLQSRFYPPHDDFYGDLHSMGNLMGFNLDEPVKDSWEQDMNEAFDRHCYFSLKKLKNDSELGPWAAQKKYQFSAGAVFYDEPKENNEQWLAEMCQNLSLSENFDVQFFVKRALRARPNSNGHR